MYFAKNFEKKVINFCISERERERENFKLYISFIQAQLDAHLKLHEEKGTNEEGGVRKCKLCNKQFVQPALYRLHIREHYRVSANN